MGDVRLANPAESKAGKSDPQLRSRERGIEVTSGPQREFHTPSSLFLERTQLADANLDEGKLGGDEEAVCDHECRDHKRFKSETKESVHRYERSRDENVLKREWGDGLSASANHKGKLPGEHGLCDDRDEKG